MPLARIGSALLFFAHIPKTGGSSVEEYLQRKGTLAFRFPWRLNWSETTAQHMHARVHKNLIPDDFFDHSFAIIRDPLTRLGSEYRYMVDTKKEDRPFELWLSETFREYEQNPFVLDNHIRPQIQFLRPGMRVFRFEDGLDGVFDWIDQVTDETPAPRKIWKKKARTGAIDFTDDIQDRVRAFYEDDYALLSGTERFPVVFEPK